MVRDKGDGSGNLLHIKEGVNQGEHLTMIAYDIRVTHLIREIRGHTSA